MRIVSVSHYYTPHVGGLEIVAENQATSLAKNGHAVVVLTCAGSGEKAGKEISKDVEIYRARASNILDRIFSIPFPIVGIGFFIRAIKVIRKADAVHLHDVFYVTSWIAFTFAFLLKRPIILTQHVAMVPHKSRVVMLVQKVVYSTLGKLIFNYSKYVIVYNPQVRDFLTSYKVSAQKILFIHNGIETSLFKKSKDFNREECLTRFGLPINRKLVLFVGRLVPKKGYDILFNARDRAFDLVFVGSGEVPKEWLQDDNFHFLGSKSQAELAMLYQAVDVFVFPAEGEMFTLVMQEAMASGLPVIASDEPGYREYDINRDLLLLCERSAKVFKEKILKVISDDRLSRAMSEYSVHLSETYFDWDNNFSKILEIYQKIDDKSVSIL